MKILLIDDSITSRILLKDILTKEGNDVYEAEDGEVGLKKIKELMPDIIFLDLLMPKIDGFDVLGQVKQRGCKIPIIVLTADIQDSVREECLELGASQFLTKPFTADKILTAVQKYNVKV